MAKPAYFILLLLISSCVLLGVGAEEAAGGIARKFLFDGSILSALGIVLGSDEQCLHYREDCSGRPLGCCASCYCKAFTSPAGYFCDGKIGC